MIPTGQSLPGFTGRLHSQRSRFGNGRRWRSSQGRRYGQHGTFRNLRLGLEKCVTRRISAATWGHALAFGDSHDSQVTLVDLVSEAVATAS